MFDALTHLALRRARTVLLFTLLATVLAGVLGAGALDRLRAGGFDDPDAESARAVQVLERDLGQPAANLVLLVTAPADQRVDTPEVVRAGLDVARRLDAEPDVRVLVSYWQAPAAAAEALRSRDSRSALVVAHLEGDEDAIGDRIAELQPAFSTSVGPQGSTGVGVQIRTGGFAQSITDITGQVRRDFARAEAIAVPLTLILLVLTFGSVLVGLLPLMIGVVSMVGTLAVLRLLTGVTDVSIFSLNLTLALGLGLGIDYALLIVNRFREQLHHGDDVESALRTTLHSAGRTVLYSAATVTAALAALLVFPMYFLRSFAYAGIAVVTLTALAAVAVLPSALRLLGHRAARRRFGRPTTARSVFWERLARVVTRRPVLTGVPAVALLALLAVPLGSVAFGLPDDRTVPAELSQARRVGDVLRGEFTSRENDAVVIALPSTPPQATASYAAGLSRLDHVSRVDAPSGTFVAGARVGPGRADLGATTASGRLASAVRVVPDAEVYSQTAQQVVHQIRALPAPGERLVGGPTARLVDVNATIGARLPFVGLLMMLSSFVVIFLFTGSVVLPLKALVTTMLGIGAVLGAMVWMFQQGHGADLFGFTATPLSVSIPPLMFCLAFGLSMDYEVFLLGRISEYHRAGLDTSAAVIAGTAHTGRIVTAAAALMSVTFLAFATSSVSFIQMLGLGCAFAVLLDATVIRGVLVPAAMRLAGRANWWAPPVVRRLHDRVGLAEPAMAPTSTLRPTLTSTLTSAAAPASGVAGLAEPGSPRVEVLTNGNPIGSRR
ncbi:MAG: MMPL family transporter [Kineosporiaceae bacterium]|nr:MMPL family transporter [Kineosporiaceae bacterium]